MSCFNCKHFSEFKKPREFDGYAIYGYCYKKRKFHEKYPRGLPVYIPDGTCKDYASNSSNAQKTVTTVEQIKFKL